MVMKIKLVLVFVVVVVVVDRVKDAFLPMNLFRYALTVTLLFFSLL